MDCGGIKTRGLHSFRDFGEHVASSNSGMPQRQSVTKTVPYMTGYYDFSDLYGGEAAWTSREVEYSFTLIGTRAEVQAKKTLLLEWLGNVSNEPIYDDDIPGRHYVGSFSASEWEEEESGEGGTLTVTFMCQPFLVADEPTSVRLAAGSHILDNVGQAARPTVIPEGTATITINGKAQSVTAETKLSIPLLHGPNDVVVAGGTSVISWYEVTF